MSCPKYPGKQRYATESVAEGQALFRSAVTGRTLRWYICSVLRGGCGWYHLTKQQQISEYGKDVGQ